MLWSNNCDISFFYNYISIRFFRNKTSYRIFRNSLVFWNFSWHYNNFHILLLWGIAITFYSFRIILYISVYLSSQVSHEKTESNVEIKEAPPFLKLFLYEEIIIILGSFIFGMISESFFYPSLTNHLIRHFGLLVKISSLFLLYCQ